MSGGAEVINKALSCQYALCSSSASTSVDMPMAGDPLAGYTPREYPCLSLLIPSPPCTFFSRLCGLMSGHAHDWQMKQDFALCMQDMVDMEIFAHAGRFSPWRRVLRVPESMWPPICCSPLSLASVSPPCSAPCATASSSSSQVWLSSHLVSAACRLPQCLTTNLAKAIMLRKE